ncbi:hypothetical protein [Micromonospora robiginosa]|uniref:Uncharacterized protein n=1 Tax=Micromonospora robiginosa TaxID=2749844 RepID=A0A7L6AZU8_9ACTN|nr:hypothetical protein [Micromonospora ferruginea]QLQ34910.1 hypothetical protein H1D33_03490 [Micromonospora ferruginea]
MTEPAHNLAAFRAARDWAAEHGHQQPDDRMLTAYGRVLLDGTPPNLTGRLTAALADVVRRCDEGVPFGSGGGRHTGWIRAEVIDGWRALLAEAACCTSGPANDSRGVSEPTTPDTDPGDGRTECDRCGKWVWPVTHSCKGVPVTDRARARRQAEG